MSEVQGRPAGTMSTERRYGIAISVALILGGVYWALTGLTEESKTTQDSYPVAGDSLTIQTTSVDVEVRSGDGPDVKVERTFERNVFGSDPKEDYEDGKLQLRDSGCGFLSFGCDTNYILTVPKDVKLTVESSSGDIKVSGLPGGANLKSSSGSIEAHDVGGSLWLESSSGDLEARGLSATTVSTQSSSGSTELDFTSAPQSVDAEASSGDVTIRLPSGTETYKLDTDTSSGDETANIRSDPSATRTIDAKTSSGDVTIEYNH
ncbi:DUF4097 family beta strand repeat-containing protein [Kribbella sp. NPDC002412]